MPKYCAQGPLHSKGIKVRDCNSMGQKESITTIYDAEKFTEHWQVARRRLKETPSPHKGKTKSLEIIAPVRRKEMEKDVCYMKKNR